MKERSTYILLIILFFSQSVIVRSQKAYTGEVTFNNIQTNKQNELLEVRFNLDITAIQIANQAIVTLIPTIVSDSLNTEHSFAPIIITGKTRDKVLNRELALQNFSFDVKPQQYIVRENGKKQLVSVNMHVPYSEWMRDARLVLREEATGCAECNYEDDEYLIKNRMLPPLFSPSYELSFITPEVEDIKQRSETHSAYLNYRVGKYELLRDFENNTAELNKVDNIIKEVRSDENLTFQTLTVTGYASPEGNYNSNMELSKNRAYSFVSYLEKAQGLDPSLMITDWKGEDWEGLKNAVEASSLSDRNEVIRIINNNNDISKRKQQLHSLNGGTTYQFLLKNFYPPLRRNEYTIAYIARAFSVEEAKEILKSKPQHLSLNEMFLVANTYPKNSEEFKEVFDIAVRLYPQDPVANLNAAAQEIENGAINQAIERLNKIELPEAYNNLGVAYTKKGENERAAEYFSKAIKLGNSTAGSNMEQLTIFLKAD